MRRGRDLTGAVYGRLVVLGPRRRVPFAKRYWACRCACGNRTDVRDDHLMQGHTKSCGCGARRNLRGVQIGQLQIIRAAPNIPSLSRALPKGHTAWVCSCACGRHIIVSTANLTRTRPTSHCGCLGLKPEVTMDRACEAPTPPAGRATSAGEALRQFHDAYSPLGAVRVWRAPTDDEDTSRALTDFDPFADGNSSWEG